MPTTRDHDESDEQHAHKTKGVDMFLHALIWIAFSGFLIWSGMSVLPAIGAGFVVTLILAAASKSTI